MRGARSVLAGAAAAALTAAGLLAPPPAHAGSGRFMRTESGDILCDVLYQGVYCGYPPGFGQAPIDPQTGRPFRMLLVESSGELKWRPGELYSWPDPEIGMRDGQSYHLYGWVVQAGADGTRFISDFTGRTVFVTTEGAQVS